MWMLRVILSDATACYGQDPGRDTLEQLYHRRRAEKAAPVEAYAIEPHILLLRPLGAVDVELPVGVTQVERPESDHLQLFLIDAESGCRSHVATPAQRCARCTTFFLLVPREVSDRLELICFLAAGWRR